MAGLTAEEEAALRVLAKSWPAEWDVPRLLVSLDEAFQASDGLTNLGDLTVAGARSIATQFLRAADAVDDATRDAHDA